MIASLEPLTLSCPIRGTLKPKKKQSADLSSLEEHHRIDAIRYCLSLGYDTKKFKIEAVVAKFGHGGKNSFRCDFAILDVDASMIDMNAPDAVDDLLQHALVLAEIKRDSSKADYVRKTQVEPLLKFAPRKDTIALYWDGVNPRVFWKEDDGKKAVIKGGPIALLPKPGKSIKANPLRHPDLLPPDSLIDVFSRIEDILHGASVSLEERYEVMLQLILAKIYDEHESESNPSERCAFQDFESIGMTPKVAAKDLNEVCVHQARPTGRIAIILPNGYLGNRSDRYVAFREWLLRQCRLVSVCGFPRFTFKTSGADVSASVVYLEKRPKPIESASEDDGYMFNAELIESVGWSVGDNKAQPVFERAETDGSYLVGIDGKKIIKSDFSAVLEDIRTSPAVSHFPWIVKSVAVSSGKKLGWAVKIDTVLNDPTLTIDPKRHSRKYAALLNAIKTGRHMKLTDIFEVVTQGKASAGTSFKKRDDETYGYIDIDNITAGDFKVNTLRGWQLPARARHLASPLDVFVGGIWSSVTKWCLIGKNSPKNLVVTNGCHRLRVKPGMDKYLIDVCIFFCSESYATQMRALARGSDGLAEIHEDDLNQVIVPLTADAKQKATLKPFVDALIEGNTSLKGAVQEMLAQAQLSLPFPISRPHHSALV